MPHKLAQRWTSRLINLTPPAVSRDGIMDLRNMDDGGNLTNGVHEHATGPPSTIKGKATPVGNGFELKLDIDHDTYEGRLVIDTANKLMIVGIKHFGTHPLAKEKTEGEEREALLDQDDPPWVITKP
jgi:hypothetical protein